MGITLAWLAASLIPPLAHADMAKLTVKEVAGLVAIQSAGVERRATVGMVFSPPAEVRVGTDGSMLLADAETTLRISANSVIAIPASAQPSGMIDRILQRSGSVLYNVNSRKGRPFAVETALLTSVVKGTLFSINVENQSTVVALLEGSLEVSGQGAEQPMLLAPGDAAHRKSGERNISVDRHNTASLGQPRAIRGDTVPGGSTDSRGLAWATEDLAQVTAAIGLAPPAPSTPAAPQVPPPASGSPPPSTSAPPASTPDPAPSTTPPPVTPPPVTPPPVSPPPVSPPPVTPPPVTPPPVTPPPVTAPPPVPPPVTAPPASSPPSGDDDDDRGGKGSRHGRGRGHEQGHGQGNDDRDRP
jgi:hypothetical protein